MCSPGLVLFGDKCHNSCPEDFYPLNMSFVSPNTSAVYAVLVCVDCNSPGSQCPQRYAAVYQGLVIVVVCITCLAAFAVLLSYVLKRTMRSKNNYEKVNYRRPHCDVDVIGLHDKHLLSSDSDSSDELELSSQTSVEFTSKQEPHSGV